MCPFSPKSRFLSGLLLLLAATTLLAPQVSAQTSPPPRSFSGADLSENFNALVSSGTGSALPSGFGFVKSNGGATYAAGTGSDNAGNVYSFGAASSSERALGTLRSNSVTPTIGVFIRNDTSQTLTQFTVSYTGEQFRLGAVRDGDATGVEDSLNFQYSTTATALDAATGFTDFDSLDFVSPITTGTVGAVSASTPLSATVTGVSVAPGATLVLRWNDFDVKSSDDGLAIDDFTFSASGDTGATPTPGGTPSATAAPTATPLPTTTPSPSAPTSGVLIGEYRLSGPSGASDEFIELYNQGNTSLDLAGWSVGGGAVSVAIPIGKVIPPYGRLLLTGSSYSLANYGGTGAAAGDVTYSGDIPLSSTLTLRNASGGAVDVVSASGLPSPTSATSNYSYVRRMDGVGGAPQDTDSDVNDFNLVDVASTVGPNNTTGVSSGLLRLGAPGPQNLASPTTANQFFSFVPASPASVRTGSGNGGTLALRYVVGNRAGGGRTITALRFRVVALTAGTTAIASDGTNSNGPADVRLISSTISGSSILPLTLQSPPAQPGGGGLNASVSLSALPGGGLTQGQSVTVELLFRVVQRGQYRFLLNLEPLTADGATSTFPDDDNMLLGNPSGAIDVASSTDKENLLVRHPGEAIGYQKSIGEPRWVSWHLTQSDIGGSGRTDNFRADTALPSDCQITSSDYTGSGFDRGHQCPSGDRTASVALNDDTFFMSNMQPQTAALNQRVWATLEDYCRSQVKAGQECYILSGGIGSSGRIAAGGKVNVPASCWKVVVILPKGTSDISRISKSTRVISVIMPNTTTITGSYTNYYSTVDAIESATGLDLLSNLPDDIENSLEASTTNR